MIFKLKSNNLENFNDNLKISESEKVLFYSALERKGIFKEFLELYLFDINESQSILILYANKYLYPIGEISSNYKINKSITIIPEFNGVLGSLEKIELIKKTIDLNNLNLNQKSFKVFDSSNKFIQDNNVSLVNKETLLSYCELRSEFIYENANVLIKPNIIYKHLKKNFSNILPAIIKENNKTVGIISSDFQSKEYSMINMLYLKKEYRAKGLSTKLMRSYMNYLSRYSKKICLFHSIDNSNAIHLYDSLGFKKIDNWIMGY